MTADRTAPGRSESGLTLVELIITVLVASVVLGVVASVFISTLQANAAARDRDLATGRAQAISTSLSTSVRNTPTLTMSGSGTIARAAVLSGSAWTCRAWAVVDLTTRTSSGAVIAAADNRYELRYFSYAPLTGTAVSPPPALGWTVLAEHVEPIRNGAASLPYFALLGSQLTWNFAVSAEEQPQLNSSSLTALSGSAAGALVTGGPRC
jgi:Tfp pilus assembly protein PilV